MAKGVEKTYKKSFAEVIVAAQKAIRDLGYKIDSLDKVNGILNFKTGMSWKSYSGQEMSIMLLDNLDETVEVSISGRMKENGVMFQITDWGETGSIANKVINAMDNYL